MAGLKVQLDMINKKLEVYYAAIGKRYVEYVENVTTDSTFDVSDILENMWIWPTTFRDWMIGTGKIGVFIWNTDIGYCNFVLYCGLIGLVLYASYYIFCALSLNNKFKDVKMLTLLLLVFQAAVWAKVMTDIFFILALLMVIDGDDMEEEVPTEEVTAIEST